MPEKADSEALTELRQDRETEVRPSSAVLGGALPERIGDYRILGRIGRGGMGEVFLAQQERPVKRRVALKLVLPGLNSAQITARFDAERQVLAMMAHPNIAKVFDAGATADGRSFFVMEYVDGLPLTLHCDRHRLNLRERLDLFLQVCEGVQHAHQKAIIHRDLKPSNVLVTRLGEQTAPRIIDFGIAKAMAPSATAASGMTVLGQIVGTPAYMSPEQADFSCTDIDTRTDVYSLAVLLYELLTGCLPHDRPGATADSDEIRRRIREDEPVRPSLRWGAADPVNQIAAEALQSSASYLVRQLRGDLDWIVMKGLEKERARRYGSPADLAADIRRHLDHQPVLAGPPSSAYRARKFVRRHRGAVGSAAIFLLLLLGFSLVTAHQARRIARESERAAFEAKAASEVAEFLEDLFEQARPMARAPGTITALELIDRGAERLRERLEDQPATRARLLGVLGSVYRHLGQFQEAGPLLEEALTIRREVFGPEHREVASSMVQLGALRREVGAHTEARELLEGGLRILEGHPPLELRLEALLQLGHLHRRQGDLELAESRGRRAVELARLVHGDDSVELAPYLGSLSATLRTRGSFPEAEALLREALDTVESRSRPNRSYLASNLNSLANLLSETGRPEEAVSASRRAVAVARDLYGDEHPFTASFLNNLGNHLWDSKDYEAAEAAHREALAIRQHLFGPDHAETAGSLYNLALVLLDSDRPDEAEEPLRKALEVWERSHGPHHLHVASVLGGLSDLHWRRGELEHSEPLARRALAIREGVLGADHPETAKMVGQLARNVEAAGRWEEAVELRERLLALRERADDPDPAVFAALRALGTSYRHLQRWADAVATLERALAMGEGDPRADESSVAEVRAELSVCRRELERTSSSASRRAPETP